MQTELDGVEVRRELRLERLMTFFCRDYEPGYHFKGESHDFWEFVLIRDGSAGVYAGEEIFHLGKGQCIWHRPNEFHSIWAEGDLPLELGVLTFSGKVPPDVSDKVFIAGNGVCSEFLGLYREAEEIFEYAENQQAEKILLTAVRDGEEMHLQSFISRMEGLLVRSLRTELPNERRHSRDAESYLRLVAVISRDPRRRMSIPEIAAECNMSVPNAKRVFSKYAGCGISVYCNSFKTEEAKKLLAGGHTVGETADMLGFEDHNYFSAFFKRMTGVSPSKFRQEQ